MGNSHGRKSSMDSPSPDTVMHSPTHQAVHYSQPVEIPTRGNQSPRGRFAVSGSPIQDGHAYAGWPAHPKLVPTVIQWSGGGERVEVEGSFDEWKSRQNMVKSGKVFQIVKLLPPGIYQYKFIVDGEWRYDPSLQAAYDNDNNVNNVLEVREYMPENLDSLAGFDPPPSPPESYNRPRFSNDDFAKEPPGIPPHLQLTLLNAPPAMDATAALPRPQHVVLNHLYHQRATHGINAIVVGTTHRYNSKYVTSVLYKPRKRKSTIPIP